MKTIRLLFIAIAMITSYELSAQVAINTDESEPDGSAMLDVKSNTKGFLPPRVANVNDVSNPVAGLLVYDQSVNCMRYYNGTVWSECMGKPFICGDPFMDGGDGKVYTTIQIGTQCWMAENLNVGTRIDGSQDQAENSTIEKYCYNDTEDSCDVYGGLYQWAEMVQYLNGATNTTSWNPIPTGHIQGICPDDWHVPTDDEWKQMEMALGMSQSQADATSWRGTDEGEKMKSTSGWNDNGNGTNSSGFTALPGGDRGPSPNGSFGYFGDWGNWWSSSEYSSTAVEVRTLSHVHDQVWRASTTKSKGFSVRCLRD